MSSLLFYKEPIPLDRKNHLGLKLKKQDNYSFADDVNSVPVAGFEFFQCSRSFPVMFVKNENEEFVPIALLSLTAKGHNLGSNWEGYYVPAFVRRYPFVLESSQAMVMFDKNAPHLTEEEGETLFGDDGEPTEVLKDIVQFLETVDRGYRMTEEFAKELKEKDLLEPSKGTIKFTDTELKLNHLYVINEKKFHESLDDEEIVKWFKRGWLSWVSAHLHSIGAMPEVLKRLPQKESEPA